MTEQKIKTGRKDIHGCDICVGDTVEGEDMTLCLEPRKKMRGIVLLNERLDFVVRSTTCETPLYYFSELKKIGMTEEQKVEINERFVRWQKEHAGRVWSVEEILRKKT